MVNYPWRASSRLRFCLAFDRETMSTDIAVSFETSQCSSALGTYPHLYLKRDEGYAGISELDSLGVLAANREGVPG